MVAIESLDAWSQEGTYSGPSLRDGSSDRWQPDPRVRTPHHSQDRIRRHSEVECDDASARSDHARQLANGCGGLIDINPEVRERQVVVGIVWAMPPSRASPDEPDLYIPRAGA